MHATYNTVSHYTVHVLIDHFQVYRRFTPNLAVVSYV